MQLVAGVFTGIRATMIGTFTGLQTSRAMQVGEGVRSSLCFYTASFLSLCQLWLIGSAVCDALIATSMIYLVRRHLIDTVTASLTVWVVTEGKYPQPCDPQLNQQGRAPRC